MTLILMLHYSLAVHILTLGVVLEQGIYRYIHVHVIAQGVPPDPPISVCLAMASLLSRFDEILG